MISVRLRARHLSWSLLLVVVSLGCGAATEQAETTASGKVTLDGAPLTGGVLLLVSKEGGKSGASGSIQLDGTFELRTTASKSGVDAGDYWVFIKPTDDMTVAGGIPAQYSDEEAPVLSATIPQEGTKDLLFELKSK